MYVILTKELSLKKKVYFKGEVHFKYDM